MRFTDVRMAIYDPRFQELFPELKVDFETHARSTCSSCVIKFVKKLINNYPERLKEYFKLINTRFL